MAVLRFFGSTPARVVRVAAGGRLIPIGLRRAAPWRALAAVALVPLAAGVLDLCLIGPLVRLPFDGKALRERCDVGKKRVIA